MHDYKPEKISLAVSILYLIVPIVIFFFGWLKSIYATIFTIPVIIFAFYIYKQLSENINYKIFTKKDLIFWIICFICICIWVYFSGIGSFSFQNRDFWGRNPIYRDLCNYDWPVIYDLSLEPDYVQTIAGTSKVAFSYYFTWWLPAALLTKILGNTEIIKNLILYLWAVLGCFIVFCNIVHIFKECKYRYLLIFVFFSGMDVIGYLLYGNSFALTDHLEWWAGFQIQYTSNTSQLYWVFNQSIPLWIISGLLMQLKDSRYIGGLSSIAIAYSPWATLGIIPIAFVGSFRNRNEIKNVFNLANISLVIVLGLVYGLFYISSTGSSGGIGTTMSYYRNDLFLFLCTYLLFIILECGAYLFLVYKDNKNDAYYYIVLLELVAFPLVWMRDGNFTMRASIPALFMLMIYVMKTINKSKDLRIKKALIVLLIIGSFTAVTEINRSVINTTCFGIKDNEEEVYSFGNIKTRDESIITISKEQFFIYDFDNTAFFKYLGK